MSVRAVMSKREDAIIFKGDETLDKALELLETYGIPKGLLMPLENVEDGGGVEATGDIWLKQKGGVKHHFKRADSFVQYGTEISCQLEKNKMKNVKGVKAKKRHMPFYVPVREIVVDEEATPPKIYFKSYANLGECFPAEYFNSKD